MDYSGWFIKSLLQRQAISGYESLLEEGVPHEISAALEDLPQSSCSADPEAFLFFRERLFYSIHPSWRTALVQSLPPALAPLAEALFFAPSPSMNRDPKKGEAKGEGLSSEEREQEQGASVLEHSEASSSVQATEEALLIDSNSQEDSLSEKLHDEEPPSPNESHAEGEVGGEERPVAIEELQQDERSSDVPPEEEAPDLSDNFKDKGQGKEPAFLLNEHLRAFLLHYLLKKSGMLDVEPQAALSQTSLEWLLHTSYDTKLSLVDLVAMHDVAEEIRRIVDKRMLQHIISIFSDLQQRYLKSLLYTAPRVAREPLDLVQRLRQGQKRELIRSYIHQRGLKRLALALKREEASFVWYIVHGFDQQRGQYLQKAIVEQDMGAPSFGLGDLSGALLHAYQFITLQQSKSGGK